MARVDFAKLRSVISKANSSSTSANTTSDSLNELMNVICNFIPHAKDLSELELSMLVISLQDYLNNRKKIGNRHSDDPINVGDIYLADLGLNYAMEIAYSHPVIILEIIDDMVLVAPTTTSDEFVNSAYHPNDNSEGNSSYRRINKGEDGLLETSAVILNNVRTIYNYRLAKRVGKMTNITDEGSIFSEIKTSVFKVHHPEILKYIKSIEDENENLKIKIDDLENEVLELKDVIKANEEIGKIG